MDLLNVPRAISGLYATGTARGQGINWKPRLGAAAATTELVGDVVGSWGFTFAEASGFVAIDASDSYAITLVPAFGDITVTGVTGTGASSLNVVYAPGAVVNGMHSWVNGNASIRWIEGYWHLYLSGFSQFVMKRPSLFPSTSPDDWQIHASGSATGVADLAQAGDGDSPVLASGRSQLDFEGGALSVGQTLGLLVQCTAGRIGFGYGTGIIILSSGQHAQIALPEGEGAWFLGNSYGIVGCAAASAATAHLVATEA